MKTHTIFTFLMLCLLLATACKKETNVIRDPQVDNYIYQVEGEEVYQTSAEKTKQKSPEQYISILHANLFKKTIAQEDLRQLAELDQAIGDKQMGAELILNSYVNTPGVIIPTNQQMRADIDKFLKETYLRFFLRIPNPYELYELKKAIEKDPGITPELVYQGFAISNEYKFY